MGCNAFKSPADLVLCDLLMPGTNSLEMTRAFELDSLAIPIIAMSDSSKLGDTDPLAFALVMGAVAILQKPLSFAVLQAAIETALERPESRPIKEGNDTELDAPPCHNLLDPLLLLG
jgi:CheY-like chemotaxis protein